MKTVVSIRFSNNESLIEPTQVISKSEPNRRQLELMLKDLVELESELNNINYKKFKQMGKVKIYHYQVNEKTWFIIVERITLLDLSEI